MARLLVLVCAVCTACAQAGAPTTGPTDAPPAHDSSKPIDARPLDAAMESCAGTTTCQTAMDLGSVSGDTGNATVMTTGFRAGWYKVRVTEDDSSVFGVQLSFTVRLISPPAANYDVLVYINTGSDVIECAQASGTVTTTGTTDSIYTLWGESGTFSNGSDDSRTVSIEVRAPTTGCSSASPWQLQVQGNT
jgi:hypothetical protein